MIYLFLLICLIPLVKLSPTLDIFMPHVSPKVKDTYLCHKYKMDAEKSFYVTGFKPQTKHGIAHHILMFGCETPGSEEDVWNCNEMSGKQSDTQFKHGPVCRGTKQSIIYAWAMDAPSLELPKNVAFKLGGHTKNKYIVLQVHYAEVDRFIKGDTDNSGVTLVGQYEPTRKLAATYLLSTDGIIKSHTKAAVYLLNTGGYIKPHGKDYFEVACQIEENKTLHPFAYRTHAHKLGIVNSGYRVTNDKQTGEQNWTEIGRRSPQLPQMFYPVTNAAIIKKGDIIAARCTMENHLDHNVYIGPTGDDEMCNFYFMYYVDEGEDVLENNMCSSNGPPSWYFEDFTSRDGIKLNVRAIPDDASDAPVTNEKQVNHNQMHDHSQMHDEESQEDSNEELNDEDEEELMQLEKQILLKNLFKKGAF